MALQIEGQTKGLQDVEDRIVVVRAYSEDDAVRRLEREWELYAAPYVNTEGLLVRFQMEEILDVGLLDREIDPAGDEVYSTFSRRRMKPEYEWHPRRSES